MRLPASYYEQLALGYLHRRDRLLDLLSSAGFQCFRPFGAYYIMTDISEFGFRSDVEFAEFLVRDVGVAAVPGSSFYKDPADGSHYLRFAFCKTEATFREAEVRLGMIKAKMEKQGK
jgi:aminotransferase